MYERLTIRTPDGYLADGAMAVERLGRLEDLLERMQTEYDQTIQAMARLSEQGKAHSATYQQLRANKMNLQEMMLRLGCI